MSRPHGALESLYHGFVEPYVLHLDKQLGADHRRLRHWTYLILFTVIFCETGLVVTPFLPGDSLLFAAGAVAGGGHISSVGAVAGRAGRGGDRRRQRQLLDRRATSGPRAFSGEVRFLKKEYLDRTHRFFERYGGKTIILARFVPIVRTFAPFVAGIGAMNYGRFLLYNVPGASPGSASSSWRLLVRQACLAVQKHFTRGRPGDHRHLGAADGDRSWSRARLIRRRRKRRDMRGLPCPNLAAAVISATIRSRRLRAFEPSSPSANIAVSRRSADTGSDFPHFLGKPTTPRLTGC